MVLMQLVQMRVFLPPIVFHCRLTIWRFLVAIFEWDLDWEDNGFLSQFSQTLAIMFLV